MPDFASSANGFAEKQLFRHVFSGEQKETYPLNAAIWLQKTISLYNFQRKNPTQPGTNRPTMEPQIRLHRPG